MLSFFLSFTNDVEENDAKSYLEAFAVGRLLKDY